MRYVIIRQDEKEIPEILPKSVDVEHFLKKSLNIVSKGDLTSGPKGVMEASNAEDSLKLQALIMDLG